MKHPYGFCLPREFPIFIGIQNEERDFKSEFEELLEKSLWPFGKSQLPFSQRFVNGICQLIEKFVAKSRRGWEVVRVSSYNQADNCLPHKLSCHLIEVPPKKSEKRKENPQAGIVKHKK